MDWSLFVIFVITFFYTTKVDSKFTCNVLSKTEKQDYLCELGVFWQIAFQTVSTPRNTSITDWHNRDMCSRSDRVFRDEVLWCLLTRDKWTYRNEGMHELNNEWFKYRLIMLRSWQEWWIFRCTISNGLFSTPRQLFLILSSPMVLWGRKYAIYFHFIGVDLILRRLELWFYAEGHWTSCKYDTISKRYCVERVCIFVEGLLALAYTCCHLMTVLKHVFNVFA